MNKLLTIRFIALLLIVFEMTGCSTLFGRQNQEEEIFFDSNISNVEVNCSGKRIKTPGALPLTQSRNHTCTAELEGYERNVFEIKSGPSWPGFAHSTALNTAAWGWWTMGIGTGVGWLMDFMSGAMKNLKQRHFQIEMKPIAEKGTKS